MVVIVVVVMLVVDGVVVVDIVVVVDVVVGVDVVVVVVGCWMVVVVVVVVGGEMCDMTCHIGNYNQQTCACGCIASRDVSKHMFICHVTHPICSNPGTSPVQKSSGLSPVLRNILPQDSKNWLVHQPILSPGSPQESSGILRNPQESSGILQESVGDNKDLPFATNIITNSMINIVVAINNEPSCMFPNPVPASIAYCSS